MNDQPRIPEETLTAYALGELGESERRAVASYLATSDEARRFVTQIEELGGLLTAELAAEAAPGLSPEQRAAITGGAPRRLSVVDYLQPLAVAAMILVVAGMWMLADGPDTRSRGAAAKPRGPVAAVDQKPDATVVLRDELLATNVRPPVKSEVQVDQVARHLAELQRQAGAAGAVVDALRAEFESRSFVGSITEATGVPNPSAGIAVYSYTVSPNAAPPAGKPRSVPAITTLTTAGSLPPGAAPAGSGTIALKVESATKNKAAPATTALPARASTGQAFEDDGRGDADLFTGAPGTEAYDQVVENPFTAVASEPLSTLSIDVDTASYANVRRFLTSGQLPPPDAVRIEELINYFPYADAAPEGQDPLAVDLEVAGCPWQLDHRLLRISLAAKRIDRDESGPSNLVFLIDVSGSMNSADKLPLLVDSMKLLVDQLRPQDSVAMVVYAGASGLVLPPTKGDQRGAILGALEGLRAGGSTNGGAGIELAYDVAAKNFVPGGVNRVILATDGDFNVGVTGRGDLVRLIEEQAKTGVFLSVLGFGRGNVKDATMEELSNKGNGNYAYIDTLREARKVLVEQIGGTLITVAKDVKLQIEFNPSRVAAYRLIGYENRVLAAQDFNDDAKDAGDVGSGHTVTALFELVPVGVAMKLPAVDPLRYQSQARGGSGSSDELLTAKLRYKEPEAQTSVLRETPLIDSHLPYSAATGEYKFAASVACFGMLLRRSAHAGTATYDTVLELAREGLGDDVGGYRAEFLTLVERARGLHTR